MSEVSIPARRSIFHEVLQPVVIVGALGYFVDIYDLILFNIVRRASLMEMGFVGDQLISRGIFLLNCQMVGMLVGGIIFGILGDRLGRVSLLFGSILLYSAANIANGFVHSVEAYAVWRFIAGVGLAGELGGSITLVSEVLSREARGYGTMLVATVGVLGAVAGGLVADLVNWRTAYFIGGGLGLALLALRVSVVESGMFKQMSARETKISRGNFFALFASWARVGKYLRCIFIGLPSWFVVGVLVSFSPEFAKALHIEGEIKVGSAVTFAYLGLAFGDFASGILSQLLRSRKKVVLGFILFTLAAIAAYFLADGRSSAVFYATVFLLGIGIGYWAVFVTIAAEQFGTNIRATVATTVPNFVRGAVVPITLGFNYCKGWLGIIPGALVIGLACIFVALWALRGLEETHGKDLDYIEMI
ncbi:MAG TPA: MFS transporter [Opitutaceae bacterium]|jgi:putative MFS transporter|nr:MFS transporter [Opitutaceae bacterium]